jgi:hypothetical protein
MKKAIQIVMGAASGFIALLVFWCIIISWDSGDEDEEDLVDSEDGQHALGNERSERSSINREGA